MSVRGWLVAIGSATALLVAAFAIGHHAGYGAGALDVRGQIREDSLKHIAKALQVTDRVLGAAHHTTAVEERKDTTARSAHAVARATVRIVNDSQVVVARVDSTRGDSGTAGVAVDGSKIDTLSNRAVVNVIASADSALAQDSVVMRSQAAELETLYRRDTLHIQTEQLLQEQLADVKPRRCGRRCGFVVGVVATAVSIDVVAHPQHVAKVVRWIVHLVP